MAAMKLALHSGPEVAGVQLLLAELYHSHSALFEGIFLALLTD